MRSPKIAAAAALLVALAAADPAVALSRSFVASTGSDGNPCTLQQPCRSFAKAVTVTDSGGEVLALDSAGYGPVVITTPVSIVAPDGIYAGITVPVDGTGVAINTPGIVTLRGLTINGPGSDIGIAVNSSAEEVYIDRTLISNTGKNVFSSAIGIFSLSNRARVVVTETTVRGNAGYGILVGTYTEAMLVVDRSRIELNGTGGIRIGGARNGGATVHDSLIARNNLAVGGAGLSVNILNGGAYDVAVWRATLENNGSGITPVGGDAASFRAVITDAVIRGNSGKGVDVGFMLAGQTGHVVVSNNHIVGNHLGSGIGCLGAGAGTLIAERNVIGDNLTGFEQADACVFKSAGNNAVEGNGTSVSGTIGVAVLR